MAGDESRGGVRREFLRGAFIRHLLPVLGGAWLSLSSFSAQAAAVCDPAPGQKVFETRCSACHSLSEHKVGPRLDGVFGRKVGSAEGFAYSPTLEQAGFKWDAEKLNGFLNAPMSFLPGTAMGFGGLHNTDERQSVVCFLQRQGSQS
ncbi:c-type cytochrome [Pseudomonas sp. GD03860]|uniref:c-type cytochrome n=1 Tax=Pseudomonas TaxID=286 RepID=UPI0023642940|nr:MULTISPECIES: c-type cytochrome [Pseudomonas]MDD2058461.1 c-type cytochrome [Pseudomonas putida]MDH0640438.1 c-type cytochrome [Pseudomonas sp. GD03860]